LKVVPKEFVMVFVKIISREKEREYEERERERERERGER
jgi:hypothetical protein